MSTTQRKIYSVSDPGMVWPAADDLAAKPDGRDYLVELDGRQIEAAQLIDCFEWLFGARR